ncbi:MAG TPA: hypothetical protein EYN69_09620 [Flavobacteriales bacterium]|nr:hypothetical protein [Flavobacteriales bacterium]
MLNFIGPKSEFIKNTLALFTGTVVAQAIPILISPLLTRIYDPQDFGLLAIYVSLSGLFGIIATGRYELAIVLPKENKDGLSLFALSIILALIIAALTLVLVALFGTQIASWYKEPKIERWLVLIPVTVLFTGIYQALNYYATRKKSFANISVSKVTDSFLNSLVKLLVGIKTIGAGGLIIGNIMGQIAGSVVLIQTFWEKGILNQIVVERQNISVQARKYSDFLKINTIHAFADVLQTTLLIFFISSFFGSAVVGLYALTLRIIKVPAGFIGGSVSQVFYQKASEKYANEEEIKPIVIKMLGSLALVSAPIFTVLILFGPELFAFVFGEGWEEAGEYAQILSPWIFLSFIISPVSQIPIIVNRQKENLLISLFGHALSIGSIIYGGLVHSDIKDTLQMLSLLQVIFLIFVVIWIVNISKTRTT